MALTSYGLPEFDQNVLLTPDYQLFLAQQDPVFSSGGEGPPENPGFPFDPFSSLTREEQGDPTRPDTFIGESGDMGDMMEERLPPRPPEEPQPGLDAGDSEDGTTIPLPRNIDDRDMRRFEPSPTYGQTQPIGIPVGTAPYDYRPIVGGIRMPSLGFYLPEERPFITDYIPGLLPGHTQSPDEQETGPGEPFNIHTNLRDWLWPTWSLDPVLAQYLADFARQVESYQNPPPLWSPDRLIINLIPSDQTDQGIRPPPLFGSGPGLGTVPNEPGTDNGPGTNEPGPDLAPWNPFQTPIRFNAPGLSFFPWGRMGGPGFWGFQSPISTRPTGYEPFSMIPFWLRRLIETSIFYPLAGIEA